MSKYTKRGDGRYQCSITIGRNPNGTPKRKYFYGATVKELREKTSLYEEDLRAGKLDEGNTLSFQLLQKHGSTITKRPPAKKCTSATAAS